MTRHIAIVGIILAASLTAAAQSITLSPLNATFAKKVKGEVTLTNNGFAPLAVTLEPETFRVVDGRFVIEPLAPTTHVRLSEYSAHISAKQIHTVGVKATCDVMPCAFIIITTAMTGHIIGDKVGVAAHLATVFYLCDKEKGCRESFISQVTPQQIAKQ